MKPTNIPGAGTTGASTGGAGNWQQQNSGKGVQQKPAQTHQQQGGKLQQPGTPGMPNAGKSNFNRDQLNKNQHDKDTRRK